MSSWWKESRTQQYALIKSVLTTVLNTFILRLFYIRIAVMCNVHTARLTRLDRFSLREGQAKLQTSHLVMKWVCKIHVAEDVVSEKTSYDVDKSEQT